MTAEPDSRLGGGCMSGNSILWLRCSVTTTSQDGSSHIQDILALFCTARGTGDKSSMFLMKSIFRTLWGKKTPPASSKLVVLHKVCHVFGTVLSHVFGSLISASAVSAQQSGMFILVLSLSDLSMFNDNFVKIVKNYIGKLTMVEIFVKWRQLKLFIRRVKDHLLG